MGVDYEVICFALGLSLLVSSLILPQTTFAKNHKNKKLRKPTHHERKVAHLIKKLDWLSEDGKVILGPVSLSKVENSNPQVLTFEVRVKNNFELDKVYDSEFNGTNVSSTGIDNCEMIGITLSGGGCKDGQYF